MQPYSYISCKIMQKLQKNWKMSIQFMDIFFINLNFIYLFWNWHAKLFKTGCLKKLHLTVIKRQKSRLVVVIHLKTDFCGFSNYTRWSILIYNPKYLLKYFIYEKMVLTKVDQDQEGHLTVPSILTLRSIFKVKWW